MATSDLGIKANASFCDAADSIIIVNALGDIPGGCTLDTTDYSGDVIPAGTVVIKDAEGEYKPLGTHEAQEAKPAVGEEGQEGYVPAVPAVEAGYEDLGEGETYVGIVKASVLASDPRVSIVTIGQINAAACPWPITNSIVQGLPRIEFLNL